METLGKTAIVNARKKQGLVVWDAGLGENPCPAPPKLIELLQLHSEKKEYTPLRGVAGLEEKVKELYTPRPTRILFGNGLKELLFVAQLAFRGTIVHITPSWVSYYKQLACVKKTQRLVEIHTSLRNEWKVSAEQLQATFKNIHEPILLLFNQPNNPTSVFYTSDEVKAIADVCRDHRVMVLADEIYANISDGFTSLAEYIPCIRASSISKDISAAGYRLGWLAFPHRFSKFAQRCEHFAATIYSCPAAPIQYAFRDFLALPNEYRKSCSHIRDIFREKTSMICQRLSESKLKFVPTMSAWYVFVSFAEYATQLKMLDVHSSRDLSEILLNEIGLVTVDGESFRCAEPLCLRFSIIDFEGMQTGINRLLLWLNNI